MNEALLKELNQFIYDYNLITTNLIYDKRDIYKNNVEIKPNYTNSTKLIELVTKFNELYQNFKKDFENLPNLNLSEEIEYVRYNSYSNGNDKLLVLDLFNPNKDLCNEDDWISLHLHFQNNLLFANLFNEEYHNNIKHINIEPEIIKNYLEVFDKHKDLLDSYDILRNAFLFGNGTTLLFSNIDGILKGLKTFTLTFGNAYMNASEFIKVTFKLDEKLEIVNYKLNLETFKEDYKAHEQEIITYLLNNIYINNSKLPKLETKEIEKSYTKKITII